MSSSSETVSQCEMLSSNKIHNIPNKSSNKRCENCDEDISPSRQEALPDCKICIECANSYEEMIQSRNRYGRR
jgi:RNA polymerase-binding transcription factor DksA